MHIHTLLLVVALAFEGVVAQPAHRHAHLHKRSLADVLEKRADDQFNDASLYKDVEWKKALKDVNWDKVFHKDGSGNTGDESGGNDTTDTKGSDTKDPDTKGSDTKGSDTKGSDTKGSDTKGSDTKGSDTKGSDTKGSDTKGSDTKGSDTKGSDTKDSSKDDGSDDDSSNDGDCSDLSDFQLEGVSKTKRATHQQDTYVGNTGGNSYGSNIIPEKNCKSSGKYSLTFENKGEASDFWIWNKIGANGEMSGMMTKAHQFYLQKGQKATFTLQSNTQMGFSKAVGRAATRGGVPNCNVGEVNYDDQNSKGGSAYDVSMVTYNQILDPKRGPPGKPVYVPMKISAKGYSDSTNENCVYTEETQNSPIKPWPGKDSCAIGPIDSSPFHVTATFE